MNTPSDETNSHRENKGIQLFDPKALAEKNVRRARVCAVVPLEWMRNGDRFQLLVPTLIKCDHCDGGGCEHCELRGAFRIAASVSVCITLPRSERTFVALRVNYPFADEHPEQLVVHVAAGDACSDNVQYVAPNHDQPTQKYAAGSANTEKKRRWEYWILFSFLALALGALAGKCL